MKHATLWSAALLLVATGCKKAENTSPAKVTKGATSAHNPTPPPSASARMPMPRKVAARHILFMYKGSMRAPSRITRTKEEAYHAAAAAYEKLKGGADFAKMARKLSDGPSKRKGGSLGTFHPRRMHPQFSAALLKLKEGEVSKPVETPFGYHLIKREALVRTSHILFMYKGSLRAPSSVTRTKDEARKAAQDVLTQLKAGGDFADLARKKSDCPSKGRGGDLGKFGPGTMAPRFEKVAFNLPVGKISGVVETPFGFHVIKRTQ